MINRSQKQEVIDSIRSNIEKSRAVFLTNLIGLPANDSTALRKSIREENGAVVITRNTLFKKAGEGTVAEKMLSDLKGPHAVAFAFEDAAGIAKCLKEAGDDFDVVDLKGGILNGEELSLDQVTQLASLPGRDEMLGTMLATFNAPISALARVMFAIQEQKGEGGATSAESAEEEKTEAPTE